MNKKPMLNQEQIHRYFNHLSGAKRIEFLYGLLHLCQPLELRYLGTCLEEIARKDYEYLYHAEQKTNHLPAQNPTATNESNAQPSTDIGDDEKLDLTDQFTRAHAIVDIALLWAKNRPCALRLFRRLKASESVKLVDMLLERDDLDERTMDEILIIFCLAANHPAFSFDMRTQMSQILKELEKRQRNMKLLQSTQNNNNNNLINNDDDEVIDPLDEASCLRHHNLSSSLLNSNNLSVHASPLLTRLAVVNYDTESSPIRVLIKADWSDNNSTLTWKTPNDIRSFHLQLSNIVYHDDVRLERLMNISGYLRDFGSGTEPDIEQMKKNINMYMAHLVYFSSYISTVSTLAKFFNSSLKLVDSKQRLFNSSSGFDEPLSSSSSFSNGVTPIQYDLSVQQASESESKTNSSPKLSFSNNNNKSKQQTDAAKQARSTVPSDTGTQTGLEVRCEETQTDDIPGPGFILAKHQDYLRRYTMEELAKLTPADLITDGLDPYTAQLLCGALDDLKPMSVHLNSNNKNSRSPCTFIQMPTSSVSPTSSQPTSMPPLLDAALMTVVQQQQPIPRTPPPGFDRMQYDPILINLAGAHASLSSSSSPKLSKAGANVAGKNVIPPPQLPLQSQPLVSPAACPSQTQHHVPLLAAHPFLYNPVEPYIFPLTIPPGFPSATSEFMRLFAPTIPTMTTNPPNNANFMQASSASQVSASSSRSTAQTNGSTTPPEPNIQSSRSSPPPPQASSRQQHKPSQSTASSQQQSQTQHHHQQQTHHRHRQYHPSDSTHFQSQNGFHAQQQRQTQSSYSQQSHAKSKACFTCGDLGHLSFACPEQYSSDSNYSHNARDGYKLDYRPRQSTPTAIQQRQLRSNSNSKTKPRDNS